MHWNFFFQIDKKLKAKKTKIKNDTKSKIKASKKIKNKKDLKSKNKKDLKSKNKKDPRSKNRNKLSNGISKEDKEENGIIDYENNRKYNHKLVGEKLRVLYDKQWYLGTIEYYSIDFKKYNILFEDDSEDYISKDEILNGKDVALLPKESSNKTQASISKSGIKHKAQGQISDTFKSELS